MEAIETIDMAEGTRVGGDALGLRPPTGPPPCDMLFSEEGGDERGVKSSEAGGVEELFAAATAPGRGTDWGGVADRAAATAAAAAALATSMLGLTLPRHMADAGTLYSRRRFLTDPTIRAINSSSFRTIYPCFVESWATRVERRVAGPPRSGRAKREVVQLT